MKRFVWCFCNKELEKGCGLWEGEWKEERCKNRGENGGKGNGWGEDGWK